jgi:CMP-N-acetylneuraminic acid synthetase
MDYAIGAAQASGIFERIICSTDHQGIAHHAVKLGIEHDARPPRLSGDDISTKEVIFEFLQRSQPNLPQLLFIVEPTSPFLRPKDITDLHDLMATNTAAVTGLTVAQPPHTHHAWNQRSMSTGMVRFIFNERKTIFAKQQKPPLYIFGNLIVCRVSNLMSGGDVFEEPTAGVEIPRPYDVNIDDMQDLMLASALLSNGLVDLPHITSIKRAC